MLKRMLVRYFRAFLSPSVLQTSVLPIGALLAFALAVGAPMVLLVMISVIALFWSMHLESEIHEVLLPEKAYTDALCYRGQYYFVWAFGLAMWAVYAVAFATEWRTATVLLTLVGAAYFVTRCLDVAKHAVAYHNKDADLDIKLLEMKPRFARWLTNGKTMDFWWNKRK